MRRLSFLNFADLEDGDIVFYNEKSRTLFRCAKPGGCATSLYRFDCEEEKFPLYGKVYRYEDKIVCVPRCADNLFIYEIPTRRTKFIPVETEDWGSTNAEKRGKFLTGIVLNNYIFIIGEWSTVIFKVDLDSEMVVERVNVSSLLDIPVDKRSVCFRSAIVYEHHILIPAYGKNQIFLLNPETLEVEAYRIHDNKNGFSSVCVVDNLIMLTPKAKESIIFLDKKFNIQRVISEYPIHYKQFENANILESVFYADKVFIFPYMTNEILYINKNDESKSVRDDLILNEELFELETEDRVIKFLFACCDDRGILAFNNITQELLHIDGNMNVTRSSYFLSEEDQYYEFNKRIESGICNEEENDLYHYMRYLRNMGQ